ncbi:MAG: hypothetical protein BWY24_00018 [Microgenomates group bacterium ADurb.Bin219]|nr:MAG: hypothetical protein BWY24_00018 [Microgenomates group bacterium ADurb.Bin219]HNP89348.1 hypothetical protein [Candidatus Woesebacteria bacterium]
MIRKIKIAFDLDGILIDKPPFVPKRLLEWLFKGSDGERLHYRFPKTKLEQLIRKLSHFYFFRPAIKENIEVVKRLAKDKRYELYIVSGRYSFLEKETYIWLKRAGIKNCFEKIFLNLGDNQPHLYKEQILASLKPDIFIDDDDLIADFLAGKFPEVKIFCCFDRGEKCRKAKFINQLTEITS